MQIDIEGNAISVTGSVAKYEDYELIRNAASEILKTSGKKLNIVFTDALTVNSALIGFMIKTVKVDNVDLQISVGNYKLYDLFKLLSLIDQLKVKKL